ncbi:MAG TPA: hypothetical protein VI365_35185 [Trebonia sp.]
MRMARGWAALAVVVAGVLAVVVGPAGSALAAAVSVPTQAVSFTTAGEHAFTVPLGVTSVHVVAIGGAGGGGYVPGGLGARVEASVRVSAGSTIYAEVGGNGAPAGLTQNDPAAGGANGGEPGGPWQDGGAARQLGVLPDSGAGGGGASDLQTCPVASCQPIDTGSGELLLVAGGGGGAGAESQGGNGGTPTGGNAGPAQDADSLLEIGTGATDTAVWSRGFQLLGRHAGPVGDDHLPDRVPAGARVAQFAGPGRRQRRCHAAGPGWGGQPAVGAGAAGVAVPDRQPGRR